MPESDNPKALLLDFGGVVMNIDFSRVFDYWASHSGVAAQTIESRWAMCPAYEEHETGDMSFSDYTKALGDQLRIELSATQWLTGWNALFAGLHLDVLEAAADTGLPVYAFTNTNEAHANCWRRLYGGQLGVFEHIYVSSEMGKRKPDLEAFDHVCADIGLAPRNIEFYDDSPTNIQAAQTAGLQTVLVEKPSDAIRALTSNHRPSR